MTIPLTHMRMNKNRNGLKKLFYCYLAGCHAEKAKEAI